MRTKLIQAIIDQIGAKSYLEIGTQYGYNFAKIKCDKKVGVDPGDYDFEYVNLTSDDYFSECEDMFDVIFIDGLHHADQVLKDFENALMHISPRGVIILHDCKPTNKAMQEIPETHLPGWTGNVWRAYLNIRRFKALTCMCVDVCTGLGVIQQKPSKNVLKIDYEDTLLMTYEEFEADKKKLLNLRTYKYFKNILKDFAKV